MKSALELRKSKQEKLNQRQKENAERINLEMLEIEKAFNKWESNLDDKKSYITVPLIIQTNEVKNLLVENGYIIDKVSNDIEVNTTRIFLDEKEYEATLKLNYFNEKMKDSYNVKIKTEPSIIKNKDTSLNNKQRDFLKKQGYYPLKENYFDMLEMISNTLKEKGGIKIECFIFNKNC